MSSRLLVPPYVESLSSYVPGKPIEEVEREYGVTDVVKLASNENPLGPSPKGLAAAQTALADIALYPDGAAVRLRQALATRHQVSADQVMVAAGSDQLIELMVRTFMAEGEEALTSESTFMMYKLAVQGHGRRCVFVPMTADHRYDLRAMRARVTERTKLVFLANPDNPGGSYFTEAELEPFMQLVPPSALVVLDEAYFEYVTAADYPSGLELRKRYPNVVVLRTFSKAYGLAGLRVGYGIARPDVVGYVDRVRGPFNVSSVAQAAALAALEDDEHVRRTRTLMASERPFVAAGLTELGAVVVPSQTNFLFADFPARPAKELFETLLKEGVIIRPMVGYGFPTAQRITLGTRPQNERLLAALKKVLVSTS